MTSNAKAVPAGPHGCMGLEITPSQAFADSCRYICACDTTIEVDVWSDGDVTSLDAPDDQFHKDRAAHAHALSVLCGGINATEVAAVEDTGSPPDWQAAYVIGQRR